MFKVTLRLTELSTSFVSLQFAAQWSSIVSLAFCHWHWAFLLAFTLLKGRHNLMLKGCNFCFTTFKITRVCGFLWRRSHSNTAGLCEDFSLFFIWREKKMLIKNTCVPVSNNLFSCFCCLSRKPGGNLIRLTLAAKRKSQESRNRDPICNADFQHTI